MGFVSCGYLENGSGVLGVPWRAVLVVSESSLLDHLSPISLLTGLFSLVDRTLYKKTSFIIINSGCCQDSGCQQI